MDHNYDSEVFFERIIRMWISYSLSMGLTLNRQDRRGINNILNLYPMTSNYVLTHKHNICFSPALNSYFVKTLFRKYV